MGGPERGGDVNRRVAEYVALQRGQEGSLTPKELKQTRFLPLRRDSVRPARSRPGAATESVATASLDATVEAAVKWAIVKGMELLANVAHPGLGHLIAVALKFKEVWDNVSVLASPDSPRDLHIPLLGDADGIEFDLNVHLSGRAEAGDHAPLVSGFVAPGAQGLFGGWQLEIDRRVEAATKEASQSKQHAWTVLTASIAQPVAQQADRAGSHGLSSPTALTFNLATSVPTNNSPLGAVTMREAASRLEGELYARPEFRDKQVIVIYDRVAGLGMWLVKPDPSKVAAQRRIEIWLNPETGMTTAFLR